MTSRRSFLKTTAMAGAAAALYKSFGAGRAWAFAQSPTNIRKFITTLPGVATQPGQTLQLGALSPQRPMATRHGQFAGLHPAHADPPMQRHRRHPQFVRQVGQQPLVRAE